jgi:hypothetical protein
MRIYFVIKVKKKGGISCQEETEQDLAVKGQEQAEEWVWEEAAAEEAEWAATNPVQGPVETAYAPIVVQRSLIS